ncbi:hypothetical protein ACUNV4_28620 [Granulosicoccus sp. 3-233]|uniref:hypothetical protein n=1 Tax=Granulosicoccus sp. 3-233 TaxID=3417969 RepID=UPI003D3364C0
MTSRLSLAQLEKLKSIMQMMLLEARNSNWPELSRLDGERRVVLNYPENAHEQHTAALAKPAISSGQRPFALTPDAKASSLPDTASSARPAGTPENHVPADDRYRVLSQEVMDLDSAIRKAIEAAKEAFLTESRGMRAQVNAKKGYEKTSNMKPRSYS